MGFFGIFFLNKTATESYCWLASFHIICSFIELVITLCLMSSGYFGKQRKLTLKVNIYLMWDDKVIFLRSNVIVAVRFLSFIKDHCSTKLQLSEKALRTQRYSGKITE